MSVVRRVVVLLVWVLRPRLPLALVRPLVRRRVRRQQDDPAAMEHAREQMRHLLGPTTPEALDAAARGYLAHWTWCDELRWHPRSVTRQPVDGAEHLVAAAAAGRGVVLSFVHHGHFDGAFASVARATGVPVHVVAAAAMMQGGGPNMRQHLRVVGSGGGLVPSDSGTRGLVAELAAGRVVAVAVDVPGSSTMQVWGRTVRCSSGSVHAALGAGAPVVVMTSHRDGDGSRISLAAPIWPDDVAGPQELLAALGRHHERPVADWPEATYVPTITWETVDETADHAPA